MISGTAFLVLLLVAMQPVTANVSMPSIFTNNMVLQQQSDVSIWGKAEMNEKISSAYIVGQSIL